MPTSPLRLLFLTGEYPPMQGGVADYTRALGQTLARMGHDVAVLTSRQAAGDGADDLTILPHIERWDWNCWAAIDRAVSDWQPHLVHIQYQTAAYALHPAINLWPWRPWRRPPVPTAVTFHDLRQPYLFPKAHLARRWVTRTLARSCTLAITTNPEDTAALRPHRRSAEPSSRAFVPSSGRGAQAEGRSRRSPDLLEIPIGSNIPSAPPPDYDRPTWRARLGLTPDAILLAYFGFLNASKGGEILVDVLARLVGTGHDAHLLMIGGRTGASDPTNLAYLQRVEASIAAHGLTPRVHWTGHLPASEVSAAFLSSDLCLLPYQDGASYRRGSFMAALAHGLPIVTTTPRVPYPDLIDGETILLAPPGDAPTLAAAVQRALADPALRQRLSANARRLAQRFSWENIAAASVAAYQTILANPTRPGHAQPEA